MKDYLASGVKAVIALMAAFLFSHNNKPNNKYGALFKRKLH